MRVAQFETNNKNLATLINEWLIDNEGVYVIDIKYNTIPNQYGITYSALMMYLPVGSDEYSDEYSNEGINLNQMTLEDVLKSMEKDVNSNQLPLINALRTLNEENDND